MGKPTTNFLVVVPWLLVLVFFALPCLKYANAELAPLEPDFNDLPAILAPVRPVSPITQHALALTGETGFGRVATNSTRSALTHGAISGQSEDSGSTTYKSRRLQSTNGTNATTPEKGKGFVHAFVAALSIVVVSEIGDKTFFIAAIMAMRHPRSTVFLGAIAALFLMTALSAALGYAVTVIPKIYTYYISAGLFAIFGIKMLIEGVKMKPEEGQEELEEVQSDLRRREEELERNPNSAENPRPGSAASRSSRQTPSISPWKLMARVFLQAFTMTFLAEWGDRSQISTIVLAATENVWGVTIGGTLGHSLCTGVAVIGGRMVAQRISVKTVTIIGGIVFLIFALSSLIIGPDGSIF